MIASVRSQVACATQRRQLLHTGRSAAPLLAAPAARTSAAASAAGPSAPAPSPVARFLPQQQRASSCQARAAAGAAEPATSSPIGSDLGISSAAKGILQYALNFARVSETYEVHSWMLLLGLLKQEDCRAALILKDLGLTDLYGAWHEVLWALNVSNGLDRRAPVPDVRFQDRAARILTGSTNFAFWAGRQKVQTEDLLMALAAGHVLTGLFPDLGLNLEHVRKAAAKHGCHYNLPDESSAERVAAEEETFL